MSKSAIFPTELSKTETLRADDLLNVDLKLFAPSRDDVFILWRAACEIEGKDANVYTHTFDSGNVYALQAKAFKEVLTGHSF